MKHLIASVVVASIILCGCDPSTKNLVGGYKLERFNENMMYYVIAPGDPGWGGVFEGTVDQIGWNQDWILARVKKMSHGDTNGWYAVDLKTKQVIGPIQESELRTNPSLSKIKCRSAEEVWKGH